MFLRIAFLTLLIQASVIVLCQNGENSSQSFEKKFALDLGLVELDVRYGRQENSDIYTLADRHIEVKLLNKLTNSEEPMGRFRVDQLEYLTFCDSFSVTDLPAASDIDCSTGHLDAEVHDPEDDPSTYANFTVKTTFHSVLASSLLLEKSIVQNLIVYRMTQEHARRKAIESAEDAKIAYSHDHFDQALNLGYYFEFKVMNTFCFGELYLSINATKQANGQIEDIVDFLISQSGDNGYLIVLENFYCKSAILGDDILLIKFLIAKRKQFPYMTVRHAMLLTPSHEAFHYDGSIWQSRNGTSPSAYNTTINIKSESSLFSFLNFTLHQTFKNDDTQNGLEEMMMLIPNHVIYVDSVWSFLNGFNKSVTLYTPPKGGDMDTLFKWFVNTNSDETVFLTFFRNDFFRTFMDALIEHSDLRAKLRDKLIEALIKLTGLWVDFKKEFVATMINQASLDGEKMKLERRHRKFIRLDL